MADTLKVLAVNHTHNSGNGYTTAITGGSVTAATVLSISVCNTHATTDHTFSLIFKDEGSTSVQIYKDQSVPAKATFIHNDKIIMDAADTLQFTGDAGDDLDIVISYLEQT